MKEAIYYSFKVWITSVFLGPIVYFIIRRVTEPMEQSHLNHMPGFTLSSLKYGLMFSVPSFILLIVFVSVINRINQNMPVKKIILSVLGILLTVLPFYFLEGSHWGVWTIRWSIAYGGLIVAGIWVYTLKTVD